MLRLCHALACVAVLAASGAAARANPSGVSEFGPYTEIERIEFGDIRIAAFGYDELVGPYGHVYSFCVAEPGHEPYAIALASFEPLNQMLRETGEIGPETRLYHVDRYDPSGYASLFFLDSAPPYPEFRYMVFAQITGLGAQPPNGTMQMRVGLMLLTPAVHPLALTERDALCAGI